MLELFAGCGGFALGWHRAGAEPVAFVERDPFARSVLARHWPGVPQHEDVATFDAGAYRGAVDVVSGGPPCQPVSSAGKRRGQADERWLWGAFVAAAVACDAPVVVAENPPALLTADGGDAFFAVLCALGDAGYSVEWDCLAAGTLGAPHRRERVFIVARRDGKTWARLGQPSMFRGRPAAWPSAGAWRSHRLTTRERAWPTPSPLPWELAADSGALPTPQAHDAKGSPGMPAQLRGSFEASLPAAVRRALPTPTASLHNDGESVESFDARRLVLAERHGNNGAGVPLAVEARRRALPTPTVRDGKDGTAEACSAVEPNALLGRVVHQRAELAGGRLSPSLPEWMMGFPLGWTLPDGPPLLASAPSLWPWLPDRTAELALTTERTHRRDRLRCVGNAVCVPVGEFVAREVLVSL